MPLEEYRRKRKFNETINGVLVSWAVPNGPSMNPAEKRLAIRAEDHPLEYTDFEGIMPEGQYGAGTVMVWDIGKYKPKDRTAAVDIPSWIGLLVAVLDEQPALPVARTEPAGRDLRRGHGRILSFKSTTQACCTMISAWRRGHRARAEEFDRSSSGAVMDATWKGIRA
jgi:hypothetical protein